MTNLEEFLRRGLAAQRAVDELGAGARVVVADDVQPSNDPGAWRCTFCGFRGFWHGGVHCLDAQRAGR